MERSSNTYQTLVGILKSELVPAMGCTEPIAVAYCAAKARQTLGCEPDRVLVEASGNIIKNVKSVFVPHTGGRRGIPAAAAVGIVAGNAERELEVVSNVTQEQIQALDEFLARVPIEVRPVPQGGPVLEIVVTVYKDDCSAKVRIINHHTGVALIQKNGETLFKDEPVEESTCEELDYSLLNIESLYDFAETMVIEDVAPIFDRQLDYNLAICDEGLRHKYGANIGKVLLMTQGSDLRARARAMTAAGSDARMNGCELPVVINSGSGNQGITASVPVYVYWQAMGIPKDRLYRALAISNLTALHLKSGIGRLSAYCGAISAGVGSGAAVCYLYGGDIHDVAHTIVNALAISSGVVCDGAKPSCAAKISLAVDSGLFGFEMFRSGQQFYDGDGLVSKGVENTIQNISRLGREGMEGTDRTIIDIMTNNV